MPKGIKPGFLDAYLIRIIMSNMEEHVFLCFVEFNKNVQGEITGNTTQYYQTTTKGFEFTDANFKIKSTI